MVWSPLPKDESLIAILYIGCGPTELLNSLIETALPTVWFKTDAYSFAFICAFSTAFLRAWLFNDSLFEEENSTPSILLMPVSKSPFITGSYFFKSRSLTESDWFAAKVYVLVL